MKLHTSPLSPAGKRVRILAHELSFPLEIAPVDFAKGENHSAAYLALNPTGKVPTLIDGDFVLWESSAILVHVAQSAGGDLWPKDLRAQSDELRWLFFGACHLDPYFTTLVVERFIKVRMKQTSDETAAHGAAVWLNRFVPILDQQLAEREYLTGRFGLADISLGCTMELSPTVRFDLERYPHVRGWLDRLQSRASWQACAPQKA
jgi:glutathione S-transferase